ncbi:papain fold toxin domain-containing protein [Phormidesmis priestleyi]
MDQSANLTEERAIEPNPEQLQAIRTIASQYQNFQCVNCAQAIQDYLISQSIRGQKIQLYTGDSVGRDSYIYDDSIVILIQNQATVFDNHHPDGLERERWLVNLMFPSRLFVDRPFQITETPF